MFGVCVYDCFVARFGRLDCVLYLELFFGCYVCVVTHYICFLITLFGLVDCFVGTLWCNYVVGWVTGLIVLVLMREDYANLLLLGGLIVL